MNVLQSNIAITIMMVSSSVKKLMMPGTTMMSLGVGIL